MREVCFHARFTFLHDSGEQYGVPNGSSILVRHHGYILDTEHTFLFAVAPFSYFYHGKIFTRHDEWVVYNLHTGGKLYASRSPTREGACALFESYKDRYRSLTDPANIMRNVARFHSAILWTPHHEPAS